MLPNTTHETFKIACAACTARFTVKKADEGKKIKCPKCRNVMVCAEADQVDSSPQKKSQSDAAPSLTKTGSMSAAKFPALADPAAPDQDARIALTPSSKPTPAKPTGAKNRDNDEFAVEVSGLVKWGGGAAVLLLVVVGCIYFGGFIIAFISAPPVGTVSGKVYYGDALLDSGTVEFFAKSGKSVKGTIKPDGTYEVRDIERGELIITVMQLNPKYKDSGTRKKEAKGKLDNYVLTNEKQHLLPEIYRDSTSSPLKFTLAKASDSHEIRLEVDADKE